MRKLALKEMSQMTSGHHKASELKIQLTARVSPVCNESVTSALLAQQLPPLPRFSGEVNDGDMDTFQDWLERFEMIAGVCGWSPQAELVNLVTRLQGQAYAFFALVQLNRRLIMLCWLQSYIRGLLQFIYKLHTK